MSTTYLFGDVPGDLIKKIADDLSSIYSCRPCKNVLGIEVGYEMSMKQL